MHDQAEISRFECRFLSESHFDLVHQKFVEAFADYVIPFNLSKDQFRNHVIVNAVDLQRSVGCFFGGEMIGFSLNGTGEWHGLKTVYDAGTGVVPEFRRRGVSRLMFETMMPIFRQLGFEQFLLEVVTTNEPAVQLYERLGFRKTRKLLLMEAGGAPALSNAASKRIEIREIEIPALAIMQQHWDGNTSWQNSFAAVERSRASKQILGGFDGDECVGYIVYSKSFGRIAQLAVAPERRKLGIGTRLVAEMRKRTVEGQKLQVINLDSGLTGAVHFFERLGFTEKIAQFEMIKNL